MVLPTLFDLDLTDFFLTVFHFDISHFQNGLPQQSKSNNHQWHFREGKLKYTGVNWKRWKSREMSGENGTSPWQPGYCLVKVAVRQTWQEVFCSPLKIESAPFPEIPRPRSDGTSSASSSSASKHSGHVFIIHEPTGSRKAIKSVADCLMAGPPFIATKLGPAIPAWQPLSPMDWLTPLKYSIMH